jgi:hypothetical protein
VPTVHPSSVIRVQGSQRDDAYSGLVKDLQAAAALLIAQTLRSPGSPVRKRRTQED